MAQVKKTAVRQAILDAAFALFAAQGYSDTTMSQIAASAGVSASNIYVYFNSKLEIVYAIFDPLLRAQLVQLESESAAIDDPGERLRHILLTIWRDIPRGNNAFMSNVMQAVATATPEQGYDRTLLSWAEAWVAGMIGHCLASAPGAERTSAARALSHVVFMALDGFAMNERLGQSAAEFEAIVDTFAAAFAGRVAQPQPEVVPA